MHPGNPCFINYSPGLFDTTNCYGLIIMFLSLVWVATWMKP